MNKEFIPYEQALALKELGFDESCLGFYDGKGNTTLYFNNKRDASGDFKPFTKTERLLWFGAPLYQQAFRWFREKHNLRAWVEWGSEYLSCAFIQYSNGHKKFIGDYSTNEEAELACLNKLIELVKNETIKD